MDKITLWLLAFLLSLFITTVQSQALSAKIVDSVSLQPIAYATVQLKNKGAITNEEGKFSFVLENDITEADSLFISYIGYETIGKPLKEFTESVIYLRSKAIELNPVIVSNKNYTADEIMDLAKEKAEVNYRQEYTKKRFFFRDAHHQNFTKTNYTFIKSTIEELNKKFIDEALGSMPKNSSYYTEILADLYGRLKDEEQKIDLVRASELYDKNNELDLSTIETKLNAILKNNVKPDSYFKVKSGWFFGTKIDGNDFDEIYKPEIDSLDEKALEKEMELQRERDLERKTDFAKYRKRTAVRMMQNQFFWKDSKINMLDKSRKYEFTLSDFTYVGNDAVYILDFIPKGSADYRGRVYVNSEDFAIIRMDYENVKSLKKFNLLGVSMNQYMGKGKMIFSKNASGYYTVQYLEEEFGSRMAVKRPLKIIEINKRVKGRNKQNELSLKLDMAITGHTKHQIIFLDSDSITESAFEGFTENNEVLPVYMPKYDPTFWKDYSIIEPNEAIKNFVSETPIH